MKSKQPEKPVPLSVKSDGIPAELRERERWVVWRYKWHENKDGTGAWKKPPFLPATGRAVDATRSTNGSTFAAAMDAYGRGKYDGIGIILGGERIRPDGPKLYFLDADDCVNPAGGIVLKETMEAVSALNTYTEYSPSKLGLHCAFYADMTTVGRRVGRYELYAAGRYMTVTGHALPGTPAFVREAEDDAPDLCLKLGLIDARLKPVATVRRSPPMSDDEVIARCSKGPGANTFRRLLVGETIHAHTDGRPDDSRSDEAFLNRLGFYTQDEAQVERIWRASARWRDKWETNAKGRADSIRKAVAYHTAYFDPKFRSGKPGKLTFQDGPVPADVVKIAPTPSEEPRNPPPTCVRQSEPHQQAPTTDGLVVERFADLDDETIEYVVPDWVARKTVTVLCGPGDAGKSTCLAWIASHAKAALFLPGHEESLRAMTKSRLRALCPNFSRLHFINSHNCVFPGVADSIIARMKAHGADMLLIDPIDNYTEDGFSDCDPKHVRHLIESLVKVAEATGAAVVAVRHTAKDQHNPLPGSRNWRTVPRRVIQLVTVGNPVKKRYMRLEKNSLPDKTPDTFYDLVPLGDKLPCRFVLGRRVSDAEAMVGRAVTDRVEHGKLDDACKLLRAWLANGRVESEWANKKAKEEQISPTTLWLARKRLGVESVQEGGGSATKHYFVPPQKWPEEEGKTNTGGGGADPVPPKG